MITLKERNESIKAMRLLRRDSAARTGAACDECGEELFRMLPGDDASFWKGPYGTLVQSERVYCTKCRFQGLMEIMPK